ncbi:MAG: metalloregulator ArsR/SmtB family transcription factor, partial [Bacteroidales bacterium]|nr:metalloregulator ArsR/SmtB family transcription factor [Bacteroidales bacterium]
VCKVLANPKRLEILNFLRNTELTVTDLVKSMKIPKSNISQHLTIMRDTGILDSRRAGKNIFYKISNKKVIKAFDLMREVLIENHSKRNKILTGDAK